MEENTSRNLSVVLCGKPEPKVQWFVGGNQTDSDISSRRLDNVTYRYTKNIMFTPNLCKKTVKYVASNNGTQVEGSSIVTISCKYLLKLLAKGLFMNCLYAQITGPPQFYL